MGFDFAYDWELPTGRYPDMWMWVIHTIDGDNYKVRYPGYATGQSIGVKSPAWWLAEATGAMSWIVYRAECGQVSKVPGHARCRFTIVNVGATPAHNTRAQ